MIPARTVLLIAVMGLTHSKRMNRATVKIGKLTSSYNSKFLEFHELGITPEYNWLEMNSSLIEDIDGGLFTTVEFFTKDTERDSFKRIFSCDLDICKFFEDSRQQPLVKMWFKNIGRFSNFPTACPVPRGLYYIKSMRVDSRSVPVYVPSGLYMVRIDTCIKSGGTKDPFATVKLEVEITRG